MQITKNEIYFSLYVLPIILLAAVVGYVVDIQWLNSYSGLLLFIDEALFTVLIVIYGKGLMQKSEKPKLPKVFSIILGIIMVSIALAGLAAIVLTNVDFKEIKRLELWNSLKLVYFGSQIFAVFYYLFTKKE